jgi:hypothetical protein
VDEQGIIEATRAALGDRELADAWAEGESLTLEQVSAELLGAASVLAAKRAEQAPVPTARYEQSLRARNPRN